MKIKLLVGLVVLVVIVGGFFVTLGGEKNETKSPTPVPNQTSNPIQNRPKQPTAKITVVVKTSGFFPASITVNTGTKVIWENKSGTDISVNSDDHPTHKLFKEFNIGHIPNNSNSSVILEKPGKYTYHDHYNANNTGTIIVE